MYLQDKEREFQASERAVQGRNLGPKSTAIYNLLRDKKPLQRYDVQGRDSTQQERVRDALTRTVAYFLSGVGLDPASINALQRSGLDPLQAGTSLVAGTPTLNDALTVSPIVVIAEVTGNSGAESSLERQVTFSTKRTLRGSAPASFTMTLRSPAPVSAAKTGEQYLLFLSDQLGAFQRAAGRKDEGPITWVSLPYEVRSSSLEPVSPAQAEGARPISALDGFVAQHPPIFKAQ